MDPTDQDLNEGSPASQLDTLIKRNFMKINAALEEQRILNRKPSQSSMMTTDSHGLGDFSIDNRKGGARTSMMSDYSGIIQQVDIDTIKYVSQDIGDQQQDSQGVPLRSVRRFSVDAAKINRITSVPQLNSPMGSPSKKSFMSSPPKTPLPPVVVTRASSASSETRSLHLHSQLDDIMREATDLHSEMEEPLRSTASLTTANESFHTADEAAYEAAEEDTPLLINTERKDDSEDVTPSFASERAQSMSTIKALEPAKKQKKHRKHHHHRHSGSHSSSPRRHHKSKRSSESDSSGKQVKPLSYHSLSKLLDATDGIAIGQEFAALNLPMEEKFLLERVVDSISRLTANMVVNPGRQDHTSQRLEKVLAALEDYD